MSSKLSHLQKLIDRIDEKYSMSDEDRLKKRFSYVKNNHFLISKKILKDILHNSKLEKILWNNLIDGEIVRQIIVVMDDSHENILFVGFLEDPRIKLNKVNLNDKVISFNSKNSYILLNNKECKSEVSIEQSMYEFNKILNKAEYTEMTIKDLL